MQSEVRYDEESAPTILSHQSHLWIVILTFSQIHICIWKSKLFYCVNHLEIIGSQVFFLIKNIWHLYISGQKSHCLPCLYFNFKLQKLDRCLIILLMYYNEKDKQLWKIYCFLLYTTASLLLAVELGPTWCREQIFQQVIDFKRTPEIILAGCYTENESPLINHFWGNFSFWINSLFLSTWHLSA